MRKVTSQDLGRRWDVPAIGGQGDACSACPVYASSVLHIATWAHATGREAESALLAPTAHCDPAWLGQHVASCPFLSRR